MLECTSVECGATGASSTLAPCLWQARGPELRRKRRCIPVRTRFRRELNRKLQNCQRDHGPWRHHRRGAPHIFRSPIPKQSTKHWCPPLITALFTSSICGTNNYPSSLLSALQGPWAPRGIRGNPGTSGSAEFADVSSEGPGNPRAHNHRCYCEVFLIRTPSGK